MDKFFLIKLSLKNLASHKLRTYLTFGAIAVGIASIVFLVSFAYGLQKMVTETVTGGDAFKLVDVGTENSQIIKLEDESINKIKAIPDVVSAEVIINAGAKEKTKGKDVDTSFYGTSGQYLDWAGTKVRWGSNLKEESTGDAVVNTVLLNKLEMNPEKSVGEMLTFDIVLPKDIAIEKDVSALKDKSYKIIGIIKDNDAPQVYVNKSDLTSSGANKFSQAKVQVSNQSSVEQVRRQIENLGLKTQYVGDTVSQIDQLFRIFKVVLASFGLIALIVATLGMFNTLTISLLERTKEVALMKILGMRRKEIKILFLTESIVISVAGGLLGILLGFLLSKGANYLLNIVATNSGGDPVTIFVFPIWFLVMVMVFAFGIGFFTGIYPARRAARIKALDVLRYE